MGSAFWQMVVTGYSKSTRGEFTVTVKEQVDGGFTPSEAEAVTVVGAPIMNTEPGTCE